MGNLERLVIHCTATREGREVSSDEIRHWHTDPVSKGGRGWSQVGYTDMVHLDGRVERLVKNNEDGCVDTWEITNGVKGYNSTSRHIVYVGGLAADGKTAKDTRTVAQKATLERYVRDWMRKWPVAEVVGHHDLNKGKACPCFDVKKWVKGL